jgi:hypothetical protein
VSLLALAGRTSSPLGTPLFALAAVTAAVLAVESSRETVENRRGEAPWSPRSGW